MKPSISLMPRSVYLPLRHMSHSPTAQFEHGTGSGRRTMPTTRSPSRNALVGPGSTTRPSDSWPSTSRALPGGAQPYLPSTISTSVPHTPTAIASTSTDPSRASGSGMSSRLELPGVSGWTVMAFIPILSGTSALSGRLSPILSERAGHAIRGTRTIEALTQSLAASAAAAKDGTSRRRLQADVRRRFELRVRATQSPGGGSIETGVRAPFAQSPAQRFGVVLGKVYCALGSLVSTRKDLEPTAFPSRNSSTVYSPGGNPLVF